MHMCIAHAMDCLICNQFKRTKSVILAQFILGTLKWVESIERKALATRHLELFGTLAGIETWNLATKKKLDKQRILFLLAFRVTKSSMQSKVWLQIFGLNSDPNISSKLRAQTFKSKVVCGPNTLKSWIPLNSVDCTTNSVLSTESVSKGTGAALGLQFGF